MISFIPDNILSQRKYLRKPSPRDVPKATQHGRDRARSHSDARRVAERRQTDRTGQAGAVWDRTQKEAHLILVQRVEGGTGRAVTRFTSSSS